MGKRDRRRKRAKQKERHEAAAKLERASQQGETAARTGVWRADPPPQA